MGCYMSTPDNKVYITEGRGKNFTYATASCQGWRREQEDAEVCIPYYDDNSSLFILCDGHGGAEVAKYTVQHLPDFLKNHQLYKEGKYKEALEKGLMDFDALLRTENVMKELHQLAFDAELLTEMVHKDSKILELKDAPSENDPDDKDDRGASAGGSSGSSSSKEAGSGPSSAAGASGSLAPGPSSSRPRTVVEDVDTETLRKEAQVPLRQLLEQYSATATGIDPAKRQSLLSKYNASPVVKPRTGEEEEPESSPEKAKDEATSASASAGEASLEPAACSSSGGSGDSAGDITKESIKESLVRQVLQHYFVAAGEDSSEDDSEYNGDESSNDDDDADDTEMSSKKHRKRKHKQRESGQDKDTSSEDDDNEDDESEDDDDDTEDSEDEDEDEDEDEEDGDDDDDDSNDDEDSIDEEINHEKVEAEHLDHDKDDENEDQDEDDNEDQWQDVQNMVRPSRGHRPGMDSGCTVVVALVKDGKLYVASAGDSRCIMIMRDGQCRPMSYDHKPDNTSEKQRIKQAGGRVIDGRVNGGLNLSRALGDFTYKNPDLIQKNQMITPCPDVRVADLNLEKVEYVFLACDGIWNSMMNQRAARFIRKTARNVNNNLVDICVQLFRQCIAPRTDGDGTGCDNMTCILARFSREDIGPNDEASASKSGTKLENSDLTTNKPEGGEPPGQQEKPDLPADEAGNTQKRSTTSEQQDESGPKKKRCIRLLEI